MIDQLIDKQCTGCTACEHICPKKAISMKTDYEGSKYPHIDYRECVKCGLCENACPVLNGQKYNRYIEPSVYAAWNLDLETRLNSTSGGVFSAMARTFIEHGGYVSGAAYGDNFEIFHMVTNQFQDIPKLRQSKYAQSDLGKVFPEIKKLLCSGEKVLFVGSPCQTAGLQNYLQKPFPSLYTCDFICRGVISQKVYQKFLRDIERQKEARLTQVHFKNKDFGWNRFSTKLTFSNGDSYQKERMEDYYMVGYLKHNLYLRPSCYACKFKQMPRQSDISFGDFWGIGEYKKELDSDQGTSVVMVNSEKGKQLLEWMRKDLFLEKRTLEEVTAGNACVLSSAPEGKYREYFFSHFEKVPFDKLIKKIDTKAGHEKWGWKDYVVYWIHSAKRLLKRE